MTFQHSLRSVQTHWPGGDTGGDQTTLADHAGATAHDPRSYAAKRVAAGRNLDLFVGTASLLRECGQRYADDQRAGLDRRSVLAGEELIERDLARVAGIREMNGGIKRH